MAVRIRLQRHGKKGKPFYHIVVADGRAPRDGKFIEKLGTYNPMTEPATIELNVDSAVKWIRNGAQPSDTARSILSYKGVMLKKHLQVGVDKGAITQEVADTKFNRWIEEKQAKIAETAKNKDQKSKDAVKNALAEEAKKRETIAQMVAEKKAQAEKSAKAAQETAQAEEAPATEETQNETEA